MRTPRGLGKVIFLFIIGVVCLIVLINRGDNLQQLEALREQARSRLSYGGEVQSVGRRDVPVQTFRTSYPKRQNMNECPKIFGNVSVFIAYVNSSLKDHYKVALNTLNCYLKSVDYPVIMVDLDSDERTKKACSQHKDLFFKKHCAAAEYLKDTDWMLVLDADTGVVNPNHCIEEWIDDRVSIILYERFFNWEIASGNYLARNTEFGRKFVKEWANFEFKRPTTWDGADNGALQVHVLDSVLPEAVQERKNCFDHWHNNTDYNTYMGYVTCVKTYLGAQRMWPGRVRIYRRGHGWVRDGVLTDDKWCSVDFMLHGWKQNTINDTAWRSPFTENPDPSICGRDLKGWRWRDEKKVSVDNVHENLRLYEEFHRGNYPKEARIHPWLIRPDVGLCWPTCDDNV